ncbi:MAG TPA: glycine zipper 2TM domain-containing protein [Campylobacterales bacterium]|nr:glycine zipper 2TM domain-containing protein [Campylobacterales bacterium]
MKKIVIASLVLATTLLNAEQMSYVEYVNVTHSTPSYENVITRVPHQECYDEQVPVTYQKGAYQQNDAGAAIVGGILGGVLGHQIGGGRGKDVATVGGAILGTFVGQNVANANRQTYQSTSSYETRRRCVTKYSEQTERKFMGYKNIAYYKGRKIVKYSDRKLSTIPITVTISY